MNDTVLIALIAFIFTSVTTLCIMIFKIFYASKCKNYSCCWNCIRANERDTEHEVSIRGLELTGIHMPNIPPIQHNLENVQVQL
jgi:hypothetical protein